MTTEDTTRTYHPPAGDETAPLSDRHPGTLTECADPVCQAAAANLVLSTRHVVWQAISTSLSTATGHYGDVCDTVADAVMGALASPGGDMRRIVEALVEVLATIAEMVGLSRDTDEPEVIIHRVRERLAAPVPADDEAADGAALIAAERRRQVEAEGWTAEHLRSVPGLRINRIKED